MVNAKMRVTKLEAALAAVGETDPTHPILFEALQHARSQAQVRPLQDRIEGTKMFIERAKKRVLKCREACEGAQKVLDEAEAKKREEEDQLKEGERRLAALLQEAEVFPPAPVSQPPPTVPVDCAAELAQLRACMEELKVERNELRS